MRPERVTDFRAVEGHPGDLAGDVVVVGDIGESLEAWNGPPEARIEQFGNLWHEPSLRGAYSGSVMDRMPVNTSGFASTLSTAAARA